MAERVEVLRIYREGDQNPITLDAVLDIGTTVGVESSRYPREDGTENTDHARLLPVTVRFRGIAVNEPIDAATSYARSNAHVQPRAPNLPPAYTTYAGRDFTDPLVEARAKGPQVDRERASGILASLVKIAEEREPVDVFVSNLRSFSALLKDVSHRHVGRDSLEISGMLEEVRFANTQDVSLEAVSRRNKAPSRAQKGGDKTKQGAKGKTEATAQEKAKAKDVFLLLSGA